MTSSRTSSDDASYAIDISPRARRKAAREIERWERRGQGPSQLAAELEAVRGRLALYPYLGQRTERSHEYRLQLGRTQFEIVYRVDTKKRMIEIRALLHGRSRRAR